MYHELDSEHAFLNFCERRLAFLQEQEKSIENKFIWQLNTDGERDVFNYNELEIDDVKHHIMLCNERINKMQFGIPSVYYP